MAAVLQSQLQKHVVRETVLAIEKAREELQRLHLVQTEPVEIDFEVAVIIDALPNIDGDVAVTRTPEQVTRTEKPAEVQTQTSLGYTSEETQTSTPGVKVTVQSHGRSVVTEVSETT